MKTTINGKEYEFEKEITISEIIKFLDINPQNIAVALNSTVVPRSELANVKVTGGDTIEIIQAVQGG